jgi:hypothetical protein
MWETKHNAPAIQMLFLTLSPEITLVHRETGVDHARHHCAPVDTATTWAILDSGLLCCQTLMTHARTSQALTMCAYALLCDEERSGGAKSIGWWIGDACDQHA